MNRQQIFDNLMKLDGLGRGFNEDEEQCAYFVEGHPGCGIGCQPGFQDQFQSIIEEENGDSDSIRTLLHDSTFGMKIKKFFGVKTDDDVSFLTGVQLLHDDNRSWNEDKWDRKFLQRFCDKWKLRMPDEGEEIADQCSSAIL